MSNEWRSPIRGSRVLVVEDDFLVGEELRAELERLGAEVVGPVHRSSEALALVTGEAAIDCATVDVSLGEETCFPVADALRDRGIPFVFVTGYTRFVPPARFQDVPCCTKPVEAEHIAAALVDEDEGGSGARTGS